MLRRGAAKRAASPSTARSSAAPGETLIAARRPRAVLLHRDRARPARQAAGAACEPGPPTGGRRDRRDAAAPRARRVQGAATLLFVIAVALVPRGDLVWPYAVDAAILLRRRRLRPRRSRACSAARLMIEVPFVLFVLVLPFVAEDGWWLAFGIVAKATLAVLATGVLAWTTPRRGDPARRRAARAAAPAGRHRRLRAALPAGHRRRAAPDAARARAARRRRRAGCGSRARRRAASARSPCARSSAASACTSRCSRAATTGGCRRCSSRPAASPVAWVGAAIVPALAIAVLVAAVAGCERRDRHRVADGRRPRHPRRGRARGVLDARRARARGRGRAAGRVRVHRARRAAGGRRDRRARRAREHATSSPSRSCCSPRGT